MYAALRAETPRIGTFAIDAATGRLDLCTSVAVGDHVAYLTTDANGHYLRSASYTGAAFAIAANGSDGRIDVQSTKITQTPPHAHCIRTDPSNRFLFISSSLGGDVILQYIFDAIAGRADPNTIPFASAPKGSGAGRFVDACQGRKFPAEWGAASSHAPAPVVAPTVASNVGCFTTKTIGDLGERRDRMTAILRARKMFDRASRSDRG